MKRDHLKTSTTIDEAREGKSRKRYEYATNNISHLFSRTLTERDIVNILDTEETVNNIDEYVSNLHMGTKQPSEWVKSGNHQIPDIPFFFCGKHHNRGKIESHLWFFKGFCSYLNPEFCQMIDIGTIPKKNSISKIVKYMQKHEKIGGACGEIEVFEPTNKELDLKKRRSCLGWLEAKSLFYAQYVEYKISHYIDKAFESFFGFVSVLPGAFSTFRWKAIQGDPLKSFFKGLNNDSHTATEANMYLAEDRIMCLEIVKKLSRDWKLTYVPNAIALTDPPATIIKFIKQRRRWTNGSLFASWYVIDHLNEITRSSHSKWEKAGFFFLYIIMILNFIFSLTLVGSMFSMFYVFTISIFP